MKPLIPEWAEAQLKQARNPIFTPDQIAEVRAMTAPKAIEQKRETITINKKSGRQKRV